MKHEDLEGKVKDNYQKALLKSSMFRHKVERDKTKFNRKKKHRKKDEDY